MHAIFPASCSMHLVTYLRQPICGNINPNYSKIFKAIQNLIRLGQTQIFPKLWRNSRCSTITCKRLMIILIRSLFETITMNTICIWRARSKNAAGCAMTFRLNWWSIQNQETDMKNIHSASRNSVTPNFWQICSKRWMGFSYFLELKTIKTLRIGWNLTSTWIFSLVAFIVTFKQIFDSIEKFKVW